ncbi:hypothetical protein ACFPYN_16495 [Paenisporosarcina macmurdoensis]|uniref:DUF1616 domain-containing protein n=1 Tax=Paenisporosarcina macmurdoensis TaxID=212659 RepID=A0ABW1LD28_9BACL
MTKVVGYAFILFGIVMGIYSTSQLFSELWFAIFMIVVFSYGPYLVGNKLRLSTKDFKKSFWQLTGAFIVGVILTPGFLLYIQNQSDVLEKIYDAESEFYFFKSGTGSNVAIVFAVFFVLITSLGYRVANGWKAGGHLLTGSIVALALFFFVYQYMTFDSYSGIHKERGYVSKAWNEEEIGLSFGSIKEFRIVPYVRYGAVSNPSEETEFMWRLIIVPLDGKEFVYNRQSIDGNWLSQTKALQEKATKEHILFTVIPMDANTYKWYQTELELTEVNPKPYNEFFGIK